MQIEKYLKDSFAGISYPKPIDISEEVLKRLPKYDFGIFADPFIRNAAVSISMVLIIFGVWFNSNLWQALEPYSQPAEGSVLKTEAAGKLNLKLPDKSRLILKENSLLEIKRLLPGIELNLFKGELLLWVTKSALRQSFTLYTSQAEIRVQGTCFKVLVDDETTKIEVLAGEVEVRSRLKNEAPIILKRFENIEIGKETAVLKKQSVQGRSIILWREVR